MRVPNVKPASAEGGMFIDEHGRLVCIAGELTITFEGEAAWFREAGQMLLRQSTIMQLSTIPDRPAVATVEIEPLRGRRG